MLENGHCFADCMNIRNQSILQFKWFNSANNIQNRCYWDLNLHKCIHAIHSNY